jgi:hypothetical protein
MCVDIVLAIQPALGSYAPHISEKYAGPVISGDVPGHFPVKQG